MDDIGTLWIGSEMVFHEAEDAVYASFVEAALVEVFGFFELAAAFIGGRGEVDAADGQVFQIFPIFDVSPPNSNSFKQ